MIEICRFSPHMFAWSIGFDDERLKRLRGLYVNHWASPLKKTPTGDGAAYGSTCRQVARGVRSPARSREAPTPAPGDAQHATPRVRPAQTASRQDVSVKKACQAKGQARQHIPPPRHPELHSSPRARMISAATRVHLRLHASRLPCTLHTPAAAAPGFTHSQPLHQPSLWPFAREHMCASPLARVRVRACARGCVCARARACAAGPTNLALARCSNALRRPRLSTWPAMAA